MKSAEEWTNELDQEARQRGFWKECLYKVKKIQAEARAAALQEMREIIDKATHNSLRKTVLEATDKMLGICDKLAASPAPGGKE